MKCEKSTEDYFFGISTVGERGQLVIPAEARKKLGINPGDKIMIVDHPLANGLVLFKVEEMRDFIKTHLEKLTRLEELSMQNSNDNNDGSS